MDPLDAIRSLLTEEQRAQHDLLCAAAAAGVMTDEEQARIEELATQGGPAWQAFLATLRYRLQLISDA